MKYIHPINTLAAKPSQQSPSSTQGCSINPVTFRMFLLLAKSKTHMVTSKSFGILYT